MEKQCYCPMCKSEATRQEMGEESFIKFNNLYKMWKRLNWLYGKNQNLGCGLKYVYGNDNGVLFTKIWNHSKSTITQRLNEYVEYSKFKGMVKDESVSMMANLNEFRDEYLKLRDSYNQAKYYETTFDAIEVESSAAGCDEAGNELYTSKTALICSCGNTDVWGSSTGRTSHLGISAKDIRSEFDKDDDDDSNGLYLEKGYDFMGDSVLNAEIKRERHIRAKYDHELNRHETINWFYDLVEDRSIGEVRKKLGRKFWLIRDVFEEYYSVKGI